MSKGTHRLLIVLILAATGGASSEASSGQDVATSRSPEPVRQLLADADAAYDRGDVAAAEHAYAAVLEADSEQPRALFRLAQIRERDPAASVELLKRYVAVVPDDAWGHLALAHAFARGGNATRAMRAYDDALTLQPRDADIQLGRPRLLARLGRIDAAIDAFEAWVSDHPADGDVWRELAGVRERAGRVRGAARALERAQALSTSGLGAAERLEGLRLRSAPVVQVGLATIGETDLFTTRPSFGGDMAVSDTVRVGMEYQQRRVESFGDVAHTRRLVVEARARPRSDVQLSMRGGAGWVARTSGVYVSDVRPEAVFGLRRTSATGGVIVDVKAQRDSIEVTPDLVRTPVWRTQVLGAVDAPLTGRLRALGQVGVARLTRADEHNRRARMMGGVALRLTGALRIRSQWHQMRHTNPAATGYFAPALSETADVGVEFERDYDRGSIALDAGSGLQRFRRTRGAAFGAWAPALRLWGLATWNVARGQHILVEFETYDSEVSDAVIVSDRWRYASVSASFRVALR